MFHRLAWQTRSFAALAVVLSGPLAEARTKVVVLDFGGSGGSSARAQVVRLLSGRHQVLPGKELLNACRELGIPFKRGTNIAIAAQRLEAIAVIGGKFSSRRLSVAVFDGKRGDDFGGGGLHASTLVRLRGRG